MHENRYYQNEATQAIENELTAGVTRQLLVMSTGSGKTETFAQLPQKLKHKLPGQQMVLLHRDELAQQAINKLRLRNSGLNVQQEAGSAHCDPATADVIVASVQTLGRKNTERIKKFNWPNIDKLVIDEAHRSIADSYYNVYEYGGYLRDDNKRLVLGVTATPRRGNGEGLGKLYQKIVYSYPLRKAIEDGYLVDIRGIRVDTSTSLAGIKTKGDDFDQTQLAQTVDTPERNLLVAKAYQANCANRIAIGFGVDIAHSVHLAQAFQFVGINAEAVWGDDPDRHDKIKRFRNGEIQVLFNAQLLVEGFDMAEIECVILAAPTKSDVVFNQRVGRGTRLNLPTGFGNLHEYVKYCQDLNITPGPPFKPDAIILDVVDSNGSLITIPTLLGLPRDMNMRGKSLLGTARNIEEWLAKHHHLDFSNLKDADKIQAFVEEVNLFEIKFPSEVEANTEFTWYPSFSGGYILQLPEKENVRIAQNLLDKFEIYGTIKGKRYRGERDTLEAAFSAADNLIKTVVPEAVKLVDRKAQWHDDAPTDKQIAALKKLYKGKQIPTNLTKGKASKLIGAAIAGKNNG